MSNLDDRMAELEKAFAVHLMECSGRHKAIEEKLDGVGKTLQGLGSKLEAQITAAASLRNLLLLGFFGIALAFLIGPEVSAKLIATFFKVT